MLYVKFGKNWLHGFRGDVVWKCWWTTDGPKVSSCQQQDSELRLRWAHRSFCWFCHAAAHIENYPLNIKYPLYLFFFVPLLLWLTRVLYGSVNEVRVPSSCIIIMVCVSANAFWDSPIPTVSLAATGIDISVLTLFDSVRWLDWWKATIHSSTGKEGIWW